MRSQGTVPRRAARRSAAGRAAAAAEAQNDEVKRHWLALPLDARLGALRFRDRALVERAFRIQQRLHSSELACYQQGIISQFNESGQAVVSTGLRHFIFEWSAEDGEEGKRQTQPGVQPQPSALSATRELVERGDFFPYLEQRLGGFLQGGVPSLRHQGLLSTFELEPNTWTEYERQIFRLVEFALFQIWQDTSAAAHPVAGATVEALANAAPQCPKGSGAEAVTALELELELEEAAAAAAADKLARKKAKKKAAARSRKEMEAARREAEEEEAEEEEEVEGDGMEEEEAEAEEQEGPEEPEEPAEAEEAGSAQAAEVPKDEVELESEVPEAIPAGPGPLAQAAPGAGSPAPATAPAEPEITAAASLRGLAMQRLSSAERSEGGPASGKHSPSCGSCASGFASASSSTRCGSTASLQHSRNPSLLSEAATEGEASEAGAALAEAPRQRVALGCPAAVVPALKDGRAWVSNGLSGDASRWSLLRAPKPTGAGGAAAAEEVEVCAWVKHTFLHIDDEPSAADSCEGPSGVRAPRRRARSCCDLGASAAER